ncbi:MAG TPA: hypothetical protein VJA66_09670 [Thermoanaerobaculia bacterium]
MVSRARSALRYIWAAPATLVGIALALFACACGARARVQNGVIEVAGGFLDSVLPSLPFSILAITFGHVVLGVRHEVLEKERAHEHAHVRQYERWGVLFFLLYLGSSFIQWARGRDPYRDNAFERRAVLVAGGDPVRLNRARFHGSNKRGPEP